MWSFSKDTNWRKFVWLPKPLQRTLSQYLSWTILKKFFFHEGNHHHTATPVLLFVNLSAFRPRWKQVLLRKNYIFWKLLSWLSIRISLKHFFFSFLQTTRMLLCFLCCSFQKKLYCVLDGHITKKVFGGWHIEPKNSCCFSELSTDRRVKHFSSKNASAAQPQMFWFFEEKQQKYLQLFWHQKWKTDV